MSPEKREASPGTWLVRRLPASFRDRFSAEMLAVVAADRGRGRAAVPIAADLAAAVVREHLSDLAADLALAVRTQLRSPISTVTALVSLAVGIGAATTVAAVFAATFVRSPPGMELSDRIVNVHVTSTGEETFRLTSYPNFEDLRRREGAFARVAGFHGLPVSLAVGHEAEPRRQPAQIVTAGYFDVIGVRPRLGRLPSAEENLRQEGVVVISSWLWQNRLDATRSPLGEAIRINGAPFTVIGVLPEGFRGHFIGFHFDLFLPPPAVRLLGVAPLEDRAAPWVEMVGRLAPEVTLEQANEDLALAARDLREAFPEINRGLEIHAAPTTGIDADLRGGLLAFLAIVGGVSVFVLFIACMNVANLLLARGVTRRREIALRRALGAPSPRIARQLLTESLLLGLAAGVGGVAAAVWMTAAARAAIAAAGIGVDLDVRIDPMVLSIALGVSILASLVFGAAPALRAVRGDLVAALRDGSLRGGQGRSTARSVLVVGQVALSLLVMVTGGLFLRALHNAAAIDPGFRVEGVWSVGIDPALLAVEEAEAPALFDRLLAAAQELPGSAAGLTARLPLSLGARFFGNPIAVEIPGWEPPAGDDAFQVEHAIVSHGYLETLAVPLRAGRFFDRGDRADTRDVAVVNEAMVRRFFAERNPLGSVVHHAGREIEIVGVAADSKVRRLTEEPEPLLYLPHTQHVPSSVVILSRQEGDPEGYGRALLAALGGVAPQLPSGGASRLEERLAVSLLPQRIAATVASVLGAVGLLLTAFGLHGLMAYAVAQRRTELGIRMALGARRADVLRLVVRRAVLLTVLGLGIGLPLTALAAQGLSGFLVGVSGLDPPTYLGFSLVLLVTGGLAGAAPAWHAARADLGVALRAE